MEWTAGRVPLISVVIPTFNRIEELRVCLDGFTNQTTGQDRFEVIVVDDGSDEDVDRALANFRDRMRLHVERCDHAGVSVARNLAIARSTAPLLVLYDDDLRPLPNLIEICLDFHDRHPAEHQLELLRFLPDPEIAEMAVVRWAFPRLYPFPEAAGIYGWQNFWGGAITCKRSLFSDWFDPEMLAVEDAEFAFRANIGRNLEIHYNGCASGYFHRRLSVQQICRRSFRMGFYRYRMSQRHRVRFSSPVYEKPETFLIPNWPAFRSALAATRGQEASGMELPAVRFQMLCGLWHKAELHAIASGWLESMSGRHSHAPAFE